MKLGFVLLFAFSVACSQDTEDSKPSFPTRTQPEQCDNSRPKTPDGIPEKTSPCTKDQDCNLGDNGRCNWVRSFESSERVCTYDECFNDSSCSSGSVCSCGQDDHIEYNIRSDANKCVSANCSVNADCGGFFCKPSLPCEGKRINGYYCTTSEDECSTSSDCPTNIPCTFETTLQKWVCDGGDCN